MTLYMVQRCLFDHLRRLEAAGDGPKPDIVTEGYNLTPEEKRALTEPDIGAIYAMGTHPVIINGFCRALGYKRADYRPLLEKAAATTAKGSPDGRNSDGLLGRPRPDDDRRSRIGAAGAGGRTSSAPWRRCATAPRKPACRPS